MEYSSKYFPQLRRVKSENAMDGEEYKSEFMAAINEPSEKEYLNAILNVLHSKIYNIEKTLSLIGFGLLIIIGLLVYKFFWNH